MSIQSSIANMLPISISIFQHASLGGKLWKTQQLPIASLNLQTCQAFTERQVSDDGVLVANFSLSSGFHKVLSILLDWIRQNDPKLGKYRIHLLKAS